MLYLLKVTVAWTLFLLLFEAVYKNNRQYTANRIYLLLSTGLGLLLPLITLPANAPVVFSGPHNFYPTNAVPAALNVVQGGPVAPTNIPVTASTPGWNLSSIIWLIYGVGAILILGKCLLELYRIMLLIKRNPEQIINGHRVIATGRLHAPYSFLDRIFLTDTASYTAQELDYILQHEAAHKQRKHWLDLWLVQITCILFWFHPLVWRYKYLLQLQHEYEADEMAAARDSYSYGHFLLQQALLNGVPSIAHSFHFSPIKNRIHMLTKKRSLKTNSWKYILLVPTLLACTFLIAKAQDKMDHELQSNEVMFQGNVFAWRPTDTLYYDKAKKEAHLIPADETKQFAFMTATKKQVVYSMNNEAVFQNEYLETPATYSNGDTAYLNYLKRVFSTIVANTPDSTSGINSLELVINKEGEVVYFEAQYYRPWNGTLINQKQWDPARNLDITFNNILSKIIRQAPRWKPARMDGKPVNSFVSFWRPDGC